MKTIRKLGLAAALLAASQLASAATVTNMNFETGGISPWLGSGSVTSAPGEVYAGSYSGKLVGDQSLLQTVSLVAGTTYDFVWRFIAGDYLPFNDTAFVITDGGATVLASVATVGDYGDSGWRYFSWVPALNYTGPIVFGIANLNDDALDSTLLLDAAVPLPGAALLFGSALLGAGALRRKQQAAAKKAALAVA